MSLEEEMNEVFNVLLTCITSPALRAQHYELSITSLERDERSFWIWRFVCFLGFGV